MSENPESHKRLRVIEILLAVVVVLMIANAIIPRYFSEIYEMGSAGDTVKEIISPISSIEIDSLFFKSLKNFNIPDSSITKKRGSYPKKKSKFFIYTVNVPNDVPIPALLQEIFTLTKHPKISFKSNETVSHNESTLDIMMGDSLEVRAKFVRKRDEVRNFGQIGFIVKDAESLDPNGLRKLFLFPEPFACLIVPSTNDQVLLKDIGENRKEYIVLLGDKTEDLNYTLSPKYEITRLKISIRFILGAFPSTKFYLFDKTSSFAKSAIYPFVRDEFTKRKYQLIEYNDLHQLTGESNDDKLKDFRSELATVNKDKSLVIVLDSKELELIQPEIGAMRKKGIKISFPSKILIPPEAPSDSLVNSKKTSAKK